MSALPKIINLPSGVKVTFEGNVLYCSRCKTPQDNFNHILVAMSELTGLSKELLLEYYADEEMTVTLYRSHG